MAIARNGKSCLAVLSLVATLLVNGPVKSETINNQDVLQTGEIIAFLTNSKIEGNQKGVKWKQSFLEGGITSYAEVNGFRPTTGTWKGVDN